MYLHILGLKCEGWMSAPRVSCMHKFCVDDGRMMSVFGFAT